MTDLQRDALMRYLHERREMSVGERFGVEWQLWIDGASRREYSEMERMHRSLSFHFAPTGVAMVPEPRVPWLRVGIASFTGVVAITSALLWVQDFQRVEHPTPATPAITSESYCLQCTVTRERCGHCLASAETAEVMATAKAATVKSPKPRCSPR